MALTMVIGLFTSIVWTIAFMFSVSDLDLVMASPTPYLTVFFQAIRNDGVALFFTVWLWLAYLSATISCYATSGRLVWAFARDNGLPFSRIFRQVSTRFQMPMNATLLTCVFAVCYGAIYCGSTTAFNAFISVSILGLNITYTVPQAIVAIRGRDKVLPARPFALGKWTGLFCNTFSSLWIAMYTFWFCVPTVIPTTALSMNYVSVIFVAALLFITVSWFLGKRKTFTGPNVVLDGVAHSASSSADTSSEAVKSTGSDHGNVKSNS
jgi:choline transport protein